MFLLFANGSRLPRLPRSSATKFTVAEQLHVWHFSIIEENGRGKKRFVPIKKWRVKKERFGEIKSQAHTDMYARMVYACMIV